MNEQNNLRLKKSNMISKDIFKIIVITVGVTTLFICGVVYIWQTSNLKHVEQTFNHEIQSLQNEITELKKTQNMQVTSIPQEKLTSSFETEAIIQDKAKDVLIAFKNKDSVKIANMAHPDFGVRFSPYSYVSTELDLVFMRHQFQNVFSDSTKYLWGYYDGTGYPILLTFEKYYDRFIYNRDFINAQKIGYNQIIGRGNTMNNNFEFYPESIIVEFYFSSDPENPEDHGVGWNSLRLVFEKKDDIWYLSGVIHDEWTI